MYREPHLLFSKPVGFLTIQSQRLTSKFSRMAAFITLAQGSIIREDLPASNNQGDRLPNQDGSFTKLYFYSSRNRRGSYHAFPGIIYSQDLVHSRERFCRSLGDFHQACQ